MRKIILNIFIVLLVFASVALAEDQIDVMTNPFFPQLPKKPEPIIAPVVVSESPTPETPLPWRRQDEQSSEVEKEKEITLPLLKISGLIWNTTRPQAIINEKVVDVGDSINVGDNKENIKIVSIDKSGLEVEYMGKSFSISP